MEKLFSVYEKSGVPPQRLSIYRTVCECCKQKIETFVDALGDFYGLAHLEKSLKDVFNLKEFKHVWGEKL